MQIASRKNNFMRLVGTKEGNVHSKQRKHVLPGRESVVIVLIHCKKKKMIGFNKVYCFCMLCILFFFYIQIFSVILETLWPSVGVFKHIKMLIQILILQEIGMFN